MSAGPIAFAAIGPASPAGGALALWFIGGFVLRLVGLLIFVAGAGGVAGGD
jgi:hypothetical protein